MPFFTVRVELHSATQPIVYEQLHNLMGLQGFSRAIKTDSGEVLQLPTAEYAINAQYHIDEVMRRADQAASGTGKTYLIFITEASATRWKNLLKVPSA